MQQLWYTRHLSGILIVSLLSATLFPARAHSQEATGAAITIPAGTSVYCELDESVTSKKKDSELGKIVRAHIWHDVEVNNTVVIKAGTPVRVEISKVKHAGVAGRKGNLELEAISTTAVDGSEVLLSGGYDKSGRSRVGMSVALFALVAWPLIFLKGKQAELERGVLFDGTVEADKTIQINESAPPIIRIAGAGGPLHVEILYDEMEKKDKPKELPLQISRNEGEIESANVISVNGKEVPPIPLKVSEPQLKDGQQLALATLELASFSKHLAKGINRFEVQSGADKVEVILNVEL